MKIEIVTFDVNDHPSRSKVKNNLEKKQKLNIQTAMCHGTLDINILDARLIIDAYKII